MERTVITCRSTGRGAFTRAEVLRGPGEVREFNRSRTGNHWEEEVEYDEDSVVFVTDISNSRKHSCFTLGRLKTLAEVEAEFGELPCGLPARLHSSD